MKPPEGYAYVGCPDCGMVMTVIHEPGETLPWCNHATGNPIWTRKKHPSTKWTRTVRVVASERLAANLD